MRFLTRHAPLFTTLRPVQARLLRAPSQTALLHSTRFTMASSTSYPPANNNDNNDDSTSPSASTNSKQPLPLPEPPTGSDATQLAVDGEGIKLDHLGPMVVNVDGTMSRIGNWDKMAPIERENTLRIIGKRNQARLATLRAAAEKVVATAAAEDDTPATKET